MKKQFDLYYKEVENVPGLFRVRLYPKSLKFAVEAINYLKDYRNLKVTSKDNGRVYEFLIAGKGAFDGLVKDLEDIQNEANEFYDTMKKHDAGLFYGARAKALHKFFEEALNEKKRPEDDKDENSADESKCKCSEDNENKECECECECSCECKKDDDDETVIQIRVSGDEKQKAEFIKRVTEAVQKIAISIIDEE